VGKYYDDTPCVHNLGQKDKMTRIDKAVQALHRGNDYLWIVCLTAGRIVGKRDGQTQELAQALLKSPSQVENYAHAYFGYKLSRKVITPSLRKSLSPGHFATLFTCWSRIEFDPALCSEYLEAAIASGMNSEQLREYIESDNNVQPKPVTLGQSWFDKGWAAIEASKLNAENRKFALDLFRRFQELMGS
jgi:hypothetical protein